MSHGELIPAPIKPIVDQKALEALDIRIGTIVLVEDLPKTSRLVRLTVDFGDHSRRVIAGLKGSAWIHARSRAPRPCSW
jgi:tRNA-binding protein